MILIALGGNVPGTRGLVLQTLQWAVREMPKFQMHVNSISQFYSTKALGRKVQSDYINAVVCVDTAMSAKNILNNLKKIEGRAGRNNRPIRINGPWGPRPLDLDIIDFKGLVSQNYHICSGDDLGNVHSVGGRCNLVLPHPQAHLRPFVMRPVVDIDPFWHHPVLGVSALSLWKGMRDGSEGRILHKIG